MGAGDGDGTTSQRIVNMEDTSKVGPEMLLDTKKIQRGLDEKSPYQWFESTFAAPVLHSLSAFENTCKRKIDLWLDHMDKGGWRLERSPSVTGPFGYAKNPHSGVVHMDEQEFRVQALFKYTRTPVKERIELNPEHVKQAEDHTARVGAAAPGPLATALEG